jgi:hypothetical protein
MSYTSNAPRVGNAKVCDPPAESYSDADLMTPFAGGVSSDSLVPEASTGRISVAILQAHVSALTAAGVIGARPTQTVGQDKETDMMKLVAADSELYNKLQTEYCYYEQRYKYAFKKFLTLATSRDAVDNRAAETMLRNAKLLNIRLNSVLEIMNYLAASRVDVVNSNKTDINRRNEMINTKLERLRKGYDLLSRDNAVILTQKEMVRYTEEKNNYATNQIALWAAANVIALGVVFYVYRS